MQAFRLDLFKNKYLVCVFLFILAISLRVFHLNFHSLWYEELMTLHYSSGSSFGSFIKSYFSHPDFHPPFYPALLFLFKSLGFKSEFELKLLSAVFGAASIPLFYILALEFFNKHSVAFFSSFLFALSGASIYYSQEIRYSSFLVFIFIVFLLNQFIIKRNSCGKWSFVSLFVVTIIFQYTHYTALPLIFFSYAFFIFRQDQIKLKRILFLIYFLTLITFIPWLDTFIFQSKIWNISKTFNVLPNLMNYYLLMLKFDFSFETFWFRSKYILNPDEVFELVLSFFGLIFTIVLYKNWSKFNYDFFKNLFKEYISYNIVFLIVLVFGPIFVFYLHDSFSVNKYFYEKVLLFTVPFTYLLFFYFLDAFLDIKYSLFAFLILSGVFCFQPLINQDYFNLKIKTEFKESAAFMFNTKKEIPIIVLCGEPEWYEYYFKLYNLENIIYVKNIEQVSSIVSSNPLFWITFAHCKPDTKYDELFSKFIAVKTFPSMSMANAILFKR